MEAQEDYERVSLISEYLKCQTVFNTIVTERSATLPFATLSTRRASYSFSSANMATVSLESTITCPSCSHQKVEIMPTDQCVFFYECENCKTMLRPLAGDCCVFCSYGSTEFCPPKASEFACC